MATVHNFISSLIISVFLLIQSYGILAQDIPPLPSPLSSPLTLPLPSPSSSSNLCAFETTPDLTWLSPEQAWQMKSTPNNDTFLIEVAKFAVEEHNKCGTYQVKYDKTIIFVLQRIPEASVYRLLIRGTTNDPQYGDLFNAVVNWMPLVHKMTLLVWTPLVKDIPYKTLCAFKNAPDSTYDLPGEWIDRTNPNSDSLLVDIAKFVVDQNNNCKFVSTSNDSFKDLIPIEEAKPVFEDNFSSDRYHSYIGGHKNNDKFKYDKIDSCDYQGFVNGDKLFRLIISTTPPSLAPSSFGQDTMSSKIKAVVYWEPEQKRKSLIYSKSSSA